MATKFCMENRNFWYDSYISIFWIWHEINCYAKNLKFAAGLESDIFKKMSNSQINYCTNLEDIPF